MNFLCRFLLTLSLIHSGSAISLPVPPIFQNLLGSLNLDLKAFNVTLNGLWNGTKYPVLSTGTLATANANAGPQLIASGHFTEVQLQMQALKAMGVKAIMVEIGFPMLYEPFFSNQSEYQQYVSFYQQVAAGVRALGMKLVVENNCLLSNDVQAGWDVAPFYASLNWGQYQAARAKTAAVIAQTVHPDYLVVLEEPDTEALMSGQKQADTTDGSNGMLTQILASVHQAGVSGMKVGAGVGSWQSDYLTYIHNFVAQPLDFIDMHIYPVNNTGNQNFLTNALNIASTAAAAGKPLTMSECWLNKVGNNELTSLSSQQVRARNVYSFWQPADVAFLQTMQNLGNYTKMAFLAPSNSNYYWAYQTYTAALANESPKQILQDETNLSADAMQQASYTGTAQSYYSSVVSPPDTVPPSTPTNLTGWSTDPSTATVTWNASTDNIGTAGYSILRNGVKIATTAMPQFADSGLAGSTTYTYVVKAFDMAGNVSAPSLSVAVTTKDIQPPSAPSKLTAAAPSCAQVTLSWSASASGDLLGYWIFRGTSPTAMTQVGSTAAGTTAFTNYSLTASTKYYFGVEAVDTSGNASKMSPTASAVTLALPSAPVHVSATASTSQQIALTWTPGSSGMPVAFYQVYRGRSSTTLAPLAKRTTASYNDLSLTPGTKYYYAVQEADTGGNASPMSAVVSATTPAH